MSQTPPKDFLPFARADAIARKLRLAFAKPTATIRFNPSHETARLSYFPAGLDESIAPLTPPGLRIVTGPPAADDDVAIVTAHGLDISSALWSLRIGGFAGTLAVWAHDNHLAPTANLATAIAADVIFPAHRPDAAVLTNPVSIRGGPVHACSGQWTIADAAALFDRFVDQPRSDRLFASLVDYPFREHAALLRQLPAHLPELELRLMRPEDRTAYFGKSRDERFADWASRKVSLIVPVARDLSMRVFDALLAGQTLVMPAELPDLDVVIPPPLQRELGIARYARFEPSAIRAAYREALAAFDTGGPAGARRRHDFVRGAHMLEHRVLAMCESLRRLAAGDLPVRFGREPSGRAGLIADGT